jgi:hypothetical protein
MRIVSELINIIIMHADWLTDWMRNAESVGVPMWERENWEGKERGQQCKRERERERERKKERETERERWIDESMDWCIYGFVYRWIDGLMEWCIDGLMYR